MEKTQLERIKEYISLHGVTHVARKTKVSVRALHYLVRGDFKPSYDTLQKLLKAMK